MALYTFSFLTIFQPGEEIFPKNTDGKLISDTVDLCTTWEVSIAAPVGREDRWEFRKDTSSPVLPPV